jgi:murein DD-endopeptidase MepM/ murein hydrolase activator NlpD
MERSTERQSLVSRLKTRFQLNFRKIHDIIGKMRNNIPSLKDIIIVVVATSLSFSFGFFIGRQTLQPISPGDYVSIRKIDAYGTAARLENTQKSPDLQDTIEEVPAPSSPVKPETPKREVPAPTQEKMIMPVQGRIISGFGWRKHPVFQDWRYHTGVDIGVAEGSPVKAALSGTVIESGTTRELGLYIVIQHPNDIKTKYAHLMSVSVQCGGSVKQGQIIGKSGTSGITSGEYLFFGVISGEELLDPEVFL